MNTSGLRTWLKKRGLGFGESPIIDAFWMEADYACTPMQMTLAGCKYRQQGRPELISPMPLSAAAAACLEPF